MQAYTTIEKAATFTYEEKRSEFIGLAFPVRTEEEAVARIAEVRAHYPDARHHVYAYRLREQQKTRYSDDHEPQGTAGMPVLNVIDKNDCTDVVIVVVRYFGGILLGTGGLVRAYTAAAVGALREAGRITYDEYARFAWRLSYADHSKIMAEFERRGVRLQEPEYTDTVTLRGSLRAPEYEALWRAVTDLTAGRAVCLSHEICYDYERAEGTN